MKKIYDVVATVGEYKNKNGETKKRYMTIGSVIEGDKGLSIKIESVPLGWSGWAGLYEPKEQQKTEKVSTGDNFDSDVPF
ncbi:MAG TPA: hypothetical protein VFM18_03165 [Methanosarcina sp.]|nr:hypothetical protein [Methanosarcina sp.]